MTRRKTSNLKTIVLLMRHMGYDRDQIEQELDESPNIIRRIISDHDNRHSPEAREHLRERRKRQRHNQARRKRLGKQQWGAATGGVPSHDRTE